MFGLPTKETSAGPECAIKVPTSETNEKQNRIAQWSAAIIRPFPFAVAEENLAESVSNYSEAEEIDSEEGKAAESHPDRV